jgi:hypothetical protein
LLLFQRTSLLISLQLSRLSFSSSSSSSSGDDDDDDQKSNPDFVLTFALKCLLLSMSMTHDPQMHWINTSWQQ